MFNVKSLLALLLALISGPVLAFMPTTGMWGVDSENNGLPGRGFQIEAENGIMIFTYFGYRPDGSGTFHVASGPIINNTFTSALLNTQGGTSMGGVHQDATVIGSAGNVTINFTSGKHGLIAFPGEPQRAISKRPFGYADGPDGLLGTWLLTEMIGQIPLSEMHILTTNTGLSTETGNGIVVTLANDFACELQISGVFAGVVVCIDYPQVTNADTYYFKFSGDRGAGTAIYKLSSGQFSSFKEAHILRIATKSGIKTGLNEGTPESLTVHSQLVQTQPSTQLREGSFPEKSLSEEDIAKYEALKVWTLEAQAILQNAP